MGTAISADGTAIAYNVTGSGPALIVIGGATQFRATDASWPALAGLLADRFTVVNYDRRGRGESGDTLPYAAAREIEDIAALIAAMGGRASLLGFSSGAVLAIEAAAAGLPVEKVIAYEPPIVVAGSGVDPDRSHLLPSAIAALEAGDRRRVAEIFFLEAVGIPRMAFERMIGSPFGPVLEGIAHTLTYDLTIVDGAYPQQKWPDRFARTETPVLILDGDRTFPFLPFGADAFAQVLPNAARSTLQGQDHGPAPEAIAPAIRAFLGA